MTLVPARGRQNAARSGCSPPLLNHALHHVYYRVCCARSNRGRPRCGLAQPLRLHGPAGRAGAHSILVPFMDPARVTPAVLAMAQEALREVSPFDFTLRRVGRFPTTAYLAPEPPDPFVAMTASLFRTFPEFPPYSGEHTDVIPHLTVAHGDAESATVAAAELEQQMRKAGPIQARCASVVLLENSTGRWKEFHLFKLVTPANSRA